MLDLNIFFASINFKSLGFIFKKWNFFSWLDLNAFAFNKDSAIIHTYEFRNKGPSPTRDKTEIDIFVPKGNNAFIDDRAKVKFLSNNGKCEKAKYISKASKFNAPSNRYTNSKACDVMDCYMHKCFVNNGWLDQSAKIEVNLNFMSEMANDDLENNQYSIFTHSRINKGKLDFFFNNHLCFWKL